MDNDKKDDYRIIEALIFASEKSVNIKDLRKKLPHVKDMKKLLLIFKTIIKTEGLF